jgi:hypothetical protein
MDFIVVLVRIGEAVSCMFGKLWLGEAVSCMPGKSGGEDWPYRGCPEKEEL